jgi:hypothetical protein
MSKNGKSQVNSSLYVYAIIPEEVDVIFDVDSINDKNDVFTIPFAGLSAVVSKTDQVDYRKLKRSDATQYLVIHQRVIEMVMQEFPLLPVRFGTTLDDTEQVIKLLNQKQQLFSEMLEKHKDQTQYEIAVLWELQPVFQAIAQTTPVQELREQIESMSRQKTTKTNGNHSDDDTLREQQIELGKLVKTIFDNSRISLQNIIFPVLRQNSIDTVINPPMDDCMVLNIALLVNESDRPILEKNLEELDAAFERNKKQLPGETNLTFRLVGPLPLYSFASVAIQPISFPIIDQARQKLGLEKTATSQDIKTAYRKKAALIHPDHQPNLENAEEQMAVLTEAYKLLSAYSDASEESCIFTESDVKNTLLVSVVRQPDFQLTTVGPIA